MRAERSSAGITPACRIVAYDVLVHDFFHADRHFPAPRNDDRGYRVICPVQSPFPLSSPAFSLAEPGLARYRSLFLAVCPPPFLLFSSPTYVSSFVFLPTVLFIPPRCWTFWRRTSGTSSTWRSGSENPDTLLRAFQAQIRSRSHTFPSSFFLLANANAAGCYRCFKRVVLGLFPTLRLKDCRLFCSSELEAGEKPRWL